MHSSWETACCESYPSAPQNLLKVQDLLLLTHCVVLCLCPKAITLSSIHIYPPSPSPNQCMCSIVVVTAVVASTVTSVQPGHYKPHFWGVFSKTKYLVMWPHGCSRDRRIPNSASHHFYTILVLKNKQNKKNPC